MNAIIYTANTCSTEYYAKLLAQKTGLPAYCLAEAGIPRYNRSRTTGSTLHLLPQHFAVLAAVS